MFNFQNDSSRQVRVREEKSRKEMNRKKVIIDNIIIQTKKKKLEINNNQSLIMLSREVEERAPGESHVYK